MWSPAPYRARRLAGRDKPVPYGRSDGHGPWGDPCGRPRRLRSEGFVVHLPFVGGRWRDHENSDVYVTSTTDTGTRTHRETASLPFARFKAATSTVSDCSRFRQRQAHTAPTSPSAAAASNRRVPSGRNQLPMARKPVEAAIPPKTAPRISSPRFQMDRVGCRIGPRRKRSAAHAIDAQANAPLGVVSRCRYSTARAVSYRVVGIVTKRSGTSNARRHSAPVLTQ